MRHIDLFSGIGGFAYAAQQVWGKDYENVFFCENNQFCQEVIKKNFGKDSIIYGDIREITADTKSRGWNYGLSDDKWTTKNKINTFISEASRVDLLTGGFPCQPYSCAGQRRGTNDDRHLWPEMLRVIKDFKPRWVIAENVRGLINIQDGVVFQQVCLDLEGEGYEVRPFIIPACAVNAPHRRDRVWIVANKQCKGLQNGDAREIQRSPQDKECERQTFRCLTSEQFDQNWLEVATELCRMDDGLPAELDRFKLTKAQHRAEKLKALGNAIVPQVAMEIMRAIKYAEANR